MFADAPEKIQLNVENVSLCSQKPWILKGTVRENVTFGQEFDEDRYFESLLFSCLLEDLTYLHLGDQTEIAENG